MTELELVIELQLVIELEFPVYSLRGPPVHGSPVWHGGFARGGVGYGVLEIIYKNFLNL
jgi:hypothetical protein